MTRGRKVNLSLEPTRSLQTQRAFRERKRQYISDLEAENKALKKENKQLKLALGMPSPPSDEEDEDAEKETKSKKKRKSKKASAAQDAGPAKKRKVDDGCATDSADATPAAAVKGPEGADVYANLRLVAPKGNPKCMIDPDRAHLEHVAYDLGAKIHELQGQLASLHQQMHPGPPRPIPPYMQPGAAPYPQPGQAMYAQISPSGPQGAAYPYTAHVAQGSHYPPLPPHTTPAPLGGAIMPNSSAPSPYFAPSAHNHPSPHTLSSSSPHTPSSPAINGRRSVTESGAALQHQQRRRMVSNGAISPKASFSASNRSSMDSAARYPPTHPAYGNQDVLPPIQGASAERSAAAHPAPLGPSYHYPVDHHGKASSAPSPGSAFSTQTLPPIRHALSMGHASAAYRGAHHAYYGSYPSPQGMPHQPSSAESSYGPSPTARDTASFPSPANIGVRPNTDPVTFTGNGVTSYERKPSMAIALPSPKMQPALSPHMPSDLRPYAALLANSTSSSPKPAAADSCCKKDRESSSAQTATSKSCSPEKGAAKQGRCPPKTGTSNSAQCGPAESSADPDVLGKNDPKQSAEDHAAISTHLGKTGSTAFCADAKDRPAAENMNKQELDLPKLNPDACCMGLFECDDKGEIVVE